MLSKKFHSTVPWHVLRPNTSALLVNRRAKCTQGGGVTSDGLGLVNSQSKARSRMGVASGRDLSTGPFSVRPNKIGTIGTSGRGLTTGREASNGRSLTARGAATKGRSLFNALPPVRLMATEAVAVEDTLKDFKDVPGPKPWPIIGNSLQLYMRPDFDVSQVHRLWENIFNEYGPIVKITVPGTPTMVASKSPDDLEIILKSTLDNPIRHIFSSLKMVRDNAPNNYFNKKAGLLPENGEEWWRLRSKVQAPLMKPRKVAMYLPMVDKTTLTFMERISSIQQEQGQMTDHFMHDLYKWALECVGHVALNKELGCLAPDLAPDSVPERLITYVNDVFGALNKTEMGIHTWRLYKSSAYRELETAHTAFTELAIQSIEEAERTLQEAAARGDASRTLTIMETFLNTPGLSKSDVTTMILDMLFAGVDTTSHALAFALYLLAKNPKAQQTLQEEVDRVAPNGPTEVLTPEQINEMVYLNHVVKETLRMYPLTAANARVLTEDISMSGYRIPKGSLALVFNMLTCQEESQFKMADSFLPERWTRERPLGPIHPYASLPFSHGKRMCIGKRIAEQEIYTFLIRAMQRFTVSLESNEPMKVKTHLVFKPDIPLNFKFIERNNQ